MRTRRAFLALAGGFALVRPPSARGQEERIVTIGVLPFGTVSWEIETMRRSGFDAAHGFKAEVVKLASNEAARIAFQSGAVDTIVSDVLWAARLRGEGRAIRFLPFSTSEGAVMAPAASPIHGPEDMKGRTIGVAGGPLDKSWLLLRAYVQKRTGADLAKEASPVFGAPPLLSHKLEVGELDAALLYWQFCARLEAKGVRRVIGAAEIARSFGLEGNVALLGYLFDEARLTGGSVLQAFAAASHETKQRLASAPEAWATVRPLMQAEDERTFQTLKRDFIAGIPQRGLAEERADAERLYQTLAEIGGERLVGPAKRLPEGLYGDAVR